MWGETSAKSGEGVAEIFTSIGESLSSTCLSVWRVLTQNWLTAKKLPLTAPARPSAGSGAGARPAGQRVSGVDLNKSGGAVGGQDGCNC